MLTKKEIKVREAVAALELSLLAGGSGLDQQIRGGYASDMLSCVMAEAKTGFIWVTMQGHPNVVAVASLLDLAAVVVTENSPVEAVTLQRAEEKGIPLLSTKHDTYTTVAMLAQLGIKGGR
jgi:predicted transcriptional regulator